jgi:hypothetical protein
LIGGSTGLGSARSVVVVPLAVGVLSTSRDVSTVGGRARASTDVTSAVPQADTTRASSLRGVGAASGSAGGLGASSVPNTVLVVVTVIHGGVLVFTRSSAVGSVPGANVDDGTAGAVGLFGATSSLVSVGFTILLALGVGSTGPHASRVSKAGFFSGVFTSTRSFASVGGSVDTAAFGVLAASTRELLARFDTGLSAVSGVDEFTVLIIGALVHVGRGVLDGTEDLAGSGSPGADGVGSTFGIRTRLGAGTNTDLVQGIPFTVVVTVTGLFAAVEVTALLGAGAFEGPVALSSLAVLLDAEHLASLFALEVGGIVLAPASAGNAVVLAERRRADLSDTSLVGGVPFAFGVESAGDVVRPLARSVHALAESGVPAAARIRDTG